MLKKLSKKEKTPLGVSERQAHIDLCLKMCQDLCRETLFLETTMSFNMRAY